MSRLAGSARPALLPRGGEKIELCVACLHSPDVTPAPTHLGLPYPPTLPQPRTSQWVECQRGGGTRRPGARGTWIPASAYAYLPKTTGWAGVHSGGTPSTDGLLPLPFLTLTLCPHVGWGAECPPRGDTAPAGAATSMATMRHLAGRGSASLWARPLEHLAQAFYTLQCCRHHQ